MSESYFQRLSQIESGGDPNAKNPNSSATGLFQFTEATAKQYGLTDPTDPQQSRMAVERFTADNKKVLQTKLGRDPTDGELYLAHQQGATGATKLLMNPTAKAVDIVGSDQVLNNGGDADMTSEQYFQKWDTKFGGDKEDAGGVDLFEMFEMDPGEKEEDGWVDLFEAEKTKLDQMIDRQTGAPAAVRMSVGGIYEPADRLDTLRQFYPDAMPYGENNFVYTDENSGKLTLYNPSGFDVGDIPSIGRELVQTVGGTIGATAGAAAGTVAGGIGALPGALAGAGVGTSTSGAAFDLLLNKFGLTVDTRTKQEVAVDFALETGLGVLGEGGGRVIGALAKKGAAVSKKAATDLFGGATKSSARLLQNFRSFGIEPLPSMVREGASFANIEASLAQKAASATTIVKKSEEITSSTHKAVQKIVSQIGRPRTEQGTGEQIKQAAVAAADRFEFKQEALYTKAFDEIGQDTLVKVDVLKELQQDLLARLTDAPRSMKGSLGNVLNRVQDIIDDVDAGVQFGTLRNIRTDLGKDLAAPHLGSASGSQNAALKMVYGALTEDISRVASSANKSAAQKLKVADRFTRMWSNTSKDTMSKIAKFDADEKAYKFAMSASKDGGTSLTRLRRNFTPEEWDTVSASVLDSLGNPTPGQTGEFSVGRFLTNWRKLAPEAKDALFGGKRYAGQKEALDKLTGLMELMKSSERFANSSNTAGTLQTGLLISALGGGIIGQVAFGATGAAMKGAAIGASAVLSTKSAAKLITSKAFIDWLAIPVERASKGPVKGLIKDVWSMREHIDKLLLLTKAQPELKEAVHEYIEVLESNTKD